MYFIGSFILEKPTDDPNSKDVYIGVTIYTFGGLFFAISGVFMQKRYFCEDKQQQEYIPARTSH